MVIPIHDANPTRRVPVVTYLLLGLTVATFFLEPVPLAPLGAGPSTAQVCRQEAFFRRWGAIPRELVRNEQLPATVGPRAVGGGCEVVRPDYEKVPLASAVTAMFLHGGLLHLLGNMLFLFVFGNNVEDRLGRLRFGVFYLLCGLVATYAFAFAFRDETATLVGASGAVAGVLGAYIVYFPRARVTSLLPFFFFLPARLPAWLVLGSWFVLQYVYAHGGGLAEGSNVAYQAHVAGFLAGVVAAVLARSGRRAR